MIMSLLVTSGPDTDMGNKFLLSSYCTSSFLYQIIHTSPLKKTFSILLSHETWVNPWGTVAYPPTSGSDYYQEQKGKTFSRTSTINRTDCIHMAERVGLTISLIMGITIGRAAPDRGVWLFRVHVVKGPSHVTRWQWCPCDHVLQNVDWFQKLREARVPNSCGLCDLITGREQETAQNWTVFWSHRSSVGSSSSQILYILRSRCWNFQFWKRTISFSFTYSSMWVGLLSFLVISITQNDLKLPNFEFGILQSPFRDEEIWLFRHRERSWFVINVWTLIAYWSVSCLFDLCSSIRFPVRSWGKYHWRIDSH